MEANAPTIEGRAQAKFVRSTPQKTRRVIDLIRGKNVGEAITILKFAPQAAAEPVRKVVESAVANARVKADRAGTRFNEKDLVVLTVTADEGPTMKRFRPRAQGRAGRIMKRTSHITVVVAAKPKPAATRPGAAGATAKTSTIKDAASKLRPARNKEGAR